MITMKQWMELVNYKVTEGSSSFYSLSPNCYTLTSWNGIDGKGGHSVSIIFDTQTQEVYDVEVSDYTNNRGYRLINPNYKKFPDFADNTAWDDVAFIDLETEEDFLEKAHAIIQGLEYDTRISIPLDLSKDELFQLFMMAHQQDITVNQLIERVLTEVIEKSSIKE